MEISPIVVNSISFGGFTAYHLLKFRKPEFRRDWIRWISFQDPFGAEFHKKNPDLLIGFVLVIVVTVLFN